MSEIKPMPSRPPSGWLLAKMNRPSLGMLSSLMALSLMPRSARAMSAASTPFLSPMSLKILLRPSWWMMRSSHLMSHLGMYL